MNQASAKGSPPGNDLAEDVFDRPCVSPVFRVLALLVGGSMLWMPLEVAREALQAGAWPRFEAFDDVATLMSVTVIGFSFAWVGVSARMPRWLFTLFRRLA